MLLAYHLPVAVRGHAVAHVHVAEQSRRRVLLEGRQVLIVAPRAPVVGHWTLSQDGSTARGGSSREWQDVGALCSVHVVECWLTRGGRDPQNAAVTREPVSPLVSIHWEGNPLQE